MKNLDLRAEMVRNGLFVYQVAEAMNVKPDTLSHYLMHDLSKATKDRIREAIAKARKVRTHVKKE